ncbi:hypothetical protein STCU_08893 [Strigomonas culicis]|uniref:Ubiquitin-like modifier-activating enzyme ATG7 n=1 Tax=Strigomonas culicis TaxID=28005 RepID=S9VC93_9TRYP|nr:hypothetical protein STCU_08893 [Strigomonas culicis]|eukprot:EPY20665.1 hypothetical protein STCU_08893 [Strigomonas culicis]
MDTLQHEELKYSKYDMAIDTSFWNESYSQKINKWRLEEPIAFLNAFVSTPLVAATQLSIPSHLAYLRNDSFLASLSESTSSRSVASVLFPGFMKNYNHLEALENMDARNALYYALYELLLRPLFFTTYESMQEEECAWNAMSFTSFCVFSFIDGKKFSFRHREAFPSLKLSSPIYVEEAFHGFSNFPLDISACEKIHQFAKERISFKNTPFVCAVEDRDVHFADFSPSMFANMAERHTNVFICFWNFSSRCDRVDSGAKNLFNCLRLALPQLQKFHFLALQGSKDACVYCACTCKQQAIESVERTFQRVVDALNSKDPQCVDWKVLFESNSDPVLKASGWISREDKVENLNSVMNPEERANKGSQCNLQLMKWRAAPNIQLDEIQNCKALLLGTGTLGCNVARNLLMWGVRHITLVDRSTVSYSNLGRQTLFLFEDAKNGTEKCIAGASALRNIIPGVCVTPVSLNIPIPGNRAGADKQELIERVAVLRDLITSHDVVFLLTDSRESRWLPSLLAAAHGTPVINVALGFDSFLVRRHGVVSVTSGSNVVGTDHGEQPLSCYFCKVIYAPSKSQLSSTLDRQCTVTRPGVSSMASALAVEMLASLYQNPAGFRFTCKEELQGNPGCLGIVPSIMRGNIRSYQINHEIEQRSSKCTACSASILNQYHAHGTDFIIKCLEDPCFIEEVCGLKEQRSTDEAALCDTFSDSSSANDN